MVVTIISRCFIRAPSVPQAVVVKTIPLQFDRSPPPPGRPRRVRVLRISCCCSPRPLRSSMTIRAARVPPICTFALHVLHACLLFVSFFTSPLIWSSCCHQIFTFILIVNYAIAPIILPGWGSSYYRRRIITTIHAHHDTDSFFVDA